MSEDMITWIYEKHKGIVYRVPVERKHKGFIVKQGFEQALWMKNGVLYDTITGIFYKFKKGEKEGSEIIYVKLGDIKINWGVPKKSGIVTTDGKTFGGHGDLIFKIINPADFIFNLVASTGQEFIDNVEKEFFVKGDKRNEKILRKKVASEEIDVKDAKRALEAFLFTKSDLKSWIINPIRSSLRDSLSKLSSAELLKVNISDLEKEIRLSNMEIFQGWGLEIKTFNIIGWQLPENL